MICSACLCECRPRYFDLSFDHAFGTQKEGWFASDCCEEPILSSEGEELTQEELKEIVEDGLY